MAQYPDIITTTAGLNIISRANANDKAVIFTRVVAGSGDLSTDASIESMTSVISAKMELPITNKEDHTNGQFTIYASLSNSDLTTGFMAKEIGVYAKVDGDTSDKLFAYTNGGAYSEYIPPKDIPIKTQILQIDVAVGNAETLNVTISDDTYATQLDLEMHNSATDAHSALTATIDDTLVPTSDTNTIRNLLSNLANRIKAATGASGWKEAPAATLASLSTMIANLATGADVTWDGKKFTNHRLGITGLMDQNGYICLGPNCGNLIIQWGSQIVALNGITQSFTLPLTISYAMAAVMTMRSGDFPGYVACPYWSECTKDTIMITPDYETGQGYTGTGKSTVTWILLAI